METLSNQLRGLIAHRINTAGDDELIGYMRAALARDNGRTRQSMAPVETTERFRVYDDFVTDSLLDVTWTRAANVADGTKNWRDAAEVCSNLRIGGVKTWALPPPAYLLSLVDYDRHNPAIHPAFKCESAGYWTNKAAAASPSGCAWIVDFSHGTSYWDSQGNGCHVRAVCPGQIVGPCSV